MHCKKGLRYFRPQSGCHLQKLSLAGNNIPIPRPRKVWSKQIQESRNFFLQFVSVRVWKL